MGGDNPVCQVFWHSPVERAFSMDPFCGVQQASGIPSAVGLEKDLSQHTRFRPDVASVVSERYRGCCVLDVFSKISRTFQFLESVKLSQRSRWYYTSSRFRREWARSSREKKVSLCEVVKL